MAHLSKFGLENFRVFKDMTELEFAPITVLTGANSSGKSSVIKALLLLKDNISKNLLSEENFFLDFTSGDHHLSNFNECVHRNGKNKEMRFWIPFTFLFIQDRMSLEFTYIVDKSNEVKNGVLVKLEVLASDGKSLMSFSKNSKVWQPTINFTYFRAEFDNFIIKQHNYKERLKSKDLLESKGKIEGQDLEEYNALLTGINEWTNYTKANRHDSLNQNKHLVFDIDWFDEPKLKYAKIHRFIKRPLLNIPFSFLCYDKGDFIEFISKGGLKAYNEELNGLGINDDKLGNYEFVYNHIKLKCEDLANEVIKKIDNKSITCIDNLLFVLSKTEEIIFENIIIKPSESPFDGQNHIEYSLKNFLVNLKFEYKRELFHKIPLDQFPIKDKKKRAFYLAYLDIILSLSDLLAYAEYKTLVDVVRYLNAQVGINPISEYMGNNSDINNYYIGYNPLKKYFDEYIRKGFIKSFEKATEVFQNVNFIEAVRANTQRYYSYNSQGTSFNSLLKEYSIANIKSDSEEKRFIDKWLVEFEIGNELVTSIIEGYGSKVSVDKTNLADLGYGVSQFLPLLIKIAVVAKKCYGQVIIEDSIDNRMPDMPHNYYSSILIVEEPETNLHPKLQSKLADMFVDAAKKFHIQFIIETHSVYLIRRLQYLTAKKDHVNNIKPEDTAIYYFYHPSANIPKGKKQVNKIEILEDGSLNGAFGDGFIDEESKWYFELLRMKKLTKN